MCTNSYFRSLSRMHGVDALSSCLFLNRGVGDHLNWAPLPGQLCILFFFLGRGGPEILFYKRPISSVFSSYFFYTGRILSS